MDIACGACGSEDLIRDPDALSQAAIPLVCLECGWRGSRTPTASCSRCGSTDIDQTPVEGAWAYEDNQDAADDPAHAAWGYFEKTIMRCRRCHREWAVAGEFRPYDPMSAHEHPPDTRAASKGFEAIWQRIQALAGELFTTKTGGSFSYDADQSRVYLRNTNGSIPKKDFVEALRRLPISGPGELQDLQGPSYLFAIITDPRVR